MFDENSRYYGLDEKKQVLDKREIVFKTRRILPKSDERTAIKQVQVNEGDRIDQVSFATVQSAEQNWKLADVNRAMNPYDLTAQVGRVLTIPQPYGQWITPQR